MTCLTGASSTQGVIGSTTNPNQVLTGESAVFFQESGTPSARRVARMAVASQSALLHLGPSSSRPQRLSASPPEGRCHRFWMQATWYFQSFWSTFMRLWALVTSALRMMKVCPCVGGCHVRASPLLPPRAGPRHLGVGWCCGGSLSGPSAPGDCPCTGW